jgi:hypothetical protein
MGLSRKKWAARSPRLQAACFPVTPSPWYIGEPGGERVIYLIFKDGEVLVETDNLEFVRRWVATDGECTVRDARTGKKVAVEESVVAP